ncbi:prepilin-type N-terminal cleavage/methylation domain-containing protein [Pelagicoccus sp. SDUM812005]|uniref:prepilin-type N-terminal cleavage/methylation domain-containing protein n=1 Tax=Pelagicoccus sp. SDUM812005 TaxID=3041257 RepID=UPI00280E83EC|nr:prepilin-type N-terminal cleavage/methylation domain-containing protein [Pelagicoccus sp. SDUM812005]MDQ8181810.1 prepilin-type N-terminal cleavage/methylation domain-containing protein [Pelagicoccus sp. SDUM812005]
MRHFSGVSRRGFTLFELLLVLALIGLFSTVFVLNINSLMKDGEMDTLEREYWRAVEAARTNAVFKQQAHYLEWDPKGNRFLVVSGGAALAFPVEIESPVELDIEVRFEEVAPENSYVLIAGQLVQTREIAKAGFFPDGTCSPFEVSMKIGDFETRFQMDPWTGVQLVNPNENEAGI